MGRVQSESRFTLWELRDAAELVAAQDRVERATEAFRVQQESLGGPDWYSEVYKEYMAAKGAYIRVQSDRCHCFSSSARMQEAKAAVREILDITAPARDTSASYTTVSAGVTATQ